LDFVTPKDLDNALCVAQLLVVHADVRGHLRALKDYFLLAKGDFLQCFLEESRPLMRPPPRPATAEEDLRVPWQQVGHSATSLSVLAFTFQQNIQRFAKSLLSPVFDLLVGVAFR
jgi:hypothetical protein